MFKKNQARENLETLIKLEGLIKSRIHVYYPEIKPNSVYIQAHFMKKCHTSTIYQFDIYNSKKISKSIIAKKRVFNEFYNNDIVEDTRQEFDTLRFLNNIPNLSLSVTRALDAIPEEGVLITEKIEGRSLYSYLSSASYLPITESKKAFSKGLCSRAGKWLVEFHKASSKGEKETINTQEFITKAERIVDEFTLFAMPTDLGKMLIDKMKRLEKDTLRYEFPLALKHGDMQPMNIVYYNGSVTVLDIGANKKDVTIKDVCNFVTGVDSFTIKNIYSFWTKEIVNELTDEFLKAYFQGETIPYKAIEFVSSLGVLEQLRKAYGRNRNFIKRKRIISFYNKEIKILTAQ